MRQPSVSMLASLAYLLGSMAVGTFIFWLLYTAWVEQTALMEARLKEWKQQQQFFYQLPPRLQYPVDLARR